MNNTTKSTCLNLRQEKFCEIIVTGVSAKEAYLRAGYKGAGNTAEVTACRLLRNPKVKARIAELRKTETKNYLMTRDEKRQVLADIVRDETVKMSDRLRAVEIDSKMAGHFEPDRVEIETGPKQIDLIRERAAHVVSVLSRVGRTGTPAAPAAIAGTVSAGGITYYSGLSRINPADRP